MRARPAWTLFSSLFAHQANRGFDLIGIWIAFFDQAHRQAVRAENQMCARAVRELAQDGADALRNSLNIKRMIVKLANRALRRAAIRLSVNAPPFLEAAKRRGVRKMGIQRQKHDLV